jgi:hypothetical protein
MSLESAKHPIVRYDETYENPFEDLPGSMEVNQVEADSADTDNALEEFGEFFSGILTGDYSVIPRSYVPTLIEPLESFLDYARAEGQDTQQKKAG